MEWEGAEEASGRLQAILRNTFPEIYKNILQNQLILLSPVTKNLPITQIFLEAHILQSTHIPDHYLNLLGQGVEIKSDSIQTSFGFKDQRACKILLEENVYDQSSTFRVYRIDKPLHGDFNVGETNSQSDTMRGCRDAMAKLMDEDSILKTMQERYLAGGTGEIVEKLLTRFKETYVFCPGFEREAALKLQQISVETTAHLQGNQRSTFVPQLVERYVYLICHERIWDHLSNSLREKSERFERNRDILRLNIPQLVSTLQVSSQYEKINFSSAVKALSQLEYNKIPHMKLISLEDVSNCLYQSIDEYKRQISSPSRKNPPFEICADDMIAIFAVCLVQSKTKYLIIHAAAIDMLLSTAPAERRISKASYVYTTFLAALTYVVQYQPPKK